MCAEGLVGSDDVVNRIRGDGLIVEGKRAGGSPAANDQISDVGGDLPLAYLEAFAEEGFCLSCWCLAIRCLAGGGVVGVGEERERRFCPRGVRQRRRARRKIPARRSRR